VPSLLIQGFSDSVIDGHVLEGVQNFGYLGVLKNSQNVISEKIKSRIAAWNRCF
jgi:hypothetical protein